MNNQAVVPNPRGNCNVFLHKTGYLASKHAGVALNDELVIHLNVEVLIGGWKEKKKKAYK